MVNLRPAQSFAVRDAFLRSFVDQLFRDLRRTEDFTEDALTAGGIRALSILLRATPVDRGELLNNWQVGIGQAPSGPIDGFDQVGDIVLSREAPKIRPAYQGTTLDDVVFGNDARHAGFVNNGTEQHPPRLFVEQARDEIESERLFPDQDFRP